MLPSTILVIEDDAATRYAYRRTLEGAGYTVHTASDGSFGLEYVARHPGECSLVVLDLMTPHVNGWKFLLQCQSNPDLRQLPVLVVTGRLAPGEKLVGYQPRAILYKPIEPARLVHAVTELVGAPAAE